MIVLIPAYQPDGRLLDLVRELTGAARHLRIVIVDDGSGPTYRSVFDAAHHLGCTVLRHGVNLGKGYALKTGLRYSVAMHRGQDVVCADADGQHTAVDVLRVAQRARVARVIVLGVRRFSGPVPPRSRVGNYVTRVLFGLATGWDLRDTQTGLRAYPAAMLPWLVSIPGDRYEYEMNVLLRAAQAGHPVEEVHIAGVYLEENASSHFRPVIDSARIYRPLLGFIASSLLAFVVDAMALFTMYALTGALLPSTIAARAVSSTLNFAVNRRFVFAAGRPRPIWATAARYWSLVVGLLVANYALLAALTGAGMGLVPAKLATEAALFAVSYLVQRLVVFARPSRSGRLVGIQPPDHRQRVVDVLTDVGHRTENVLHRTLAVDDIRDPAGQHAQHRRHPVAVTDPAALVAE